VSSQPILCQDPHANVPLANAHASPILDEVSASPDHLSRTEIGLHVVTAERNGVLHLVVRGMISESEAIGFKKAMADFGQQNPAYHFIVIVTELTGVSSGARRALVIHQQAYPFGCCYIVGASFATRTLIAGIYRARRFLQPHTITGSAITVGSEEEARQMIAAHRRENARRADS
jgi:hypothetical protein